MSAEQQSMPDDTDAQDAARYRWLKRRLVGADFDYDRVGGVLIFSRPTGKAVSANLSRSIDDAMKEQK